MKNAFFLLLAVLTMCITSFDTVDHPGYTIGDKVLQFKLRNIDGSLIGLSDYTESKGVILIFTCNHCPFSVAYEDRIIALHQKFAAQGYPVMAINSNDPVAYPADSYENMIERAQEKKFPFVYLWDETQAIAKAFGALKTPHVYILKKKEKDFHVEYIGAIDDNSNEPELVKATYVQNAVNALLQGTKVDPTFTKAVGCGLKWKKN